MRKWFLLAVLAGVVALTAGPAWAGGPSNGLERAMAVQEAHTDGLMGIPGVVGTAVGLGADGSPAVFVFTERAGIGGIPGRLDGVPVAVHVTGKIVALADPPGKAIGRGTKIDPKKRFERPVPIGVSTGNAGSCSAGTIGARVTDGTNVYALSNNHVYALENKAPIGSEVLQPGLYDTGCVYNADNHLGNLSAYKAIDFSGGDNVVDAAIAISSTANLGKATSSDGYGTPKSAIMAAALNQKVMKYGRTTKLTRGSVVGINSTVNVGYSSGTAKFVNQIVILGTKPFLKAGDSGSLVVTDPGKNPVGLAFAGSATGYAIANPIDAVLGALGVGIDGE